MAAVIFMKRRQGAPLVTDEDRVREGHEGNGTNAEGDPKYVEEMPSWSGSFQHSPGSVMARLPKSNEIIKKGFLSRFSSNNEWKRTQVILNTVGVYLARTGENMLRDMIPLDEITEVKKRTDIPESALSMTEITTSQDDPGAGASAESSMSDIHAIQIRTIENGYNSGRTYFFRAESSEECSSWTHQIRNASQKAILLKEAGPGVLSQAKYRLRMAYESFAAQSVLAVLIIFSFITNILQTELSEETANADSTAAAFDALEYFFTFAFTVELVINMLAHFIIPFFQVPALRAL
jgi:hypothetical protein